MTTDLAYGPWQWGSPSALKETKAQREHGASLRQALDLWMPAQMALEMAGAGLTTRTLLQALGHRLDLEATPDESVLGRFHRLVDAYLADELRTCPPDPTLLPSAAEWYARELHWPVFPLQPQGKQPYPGSRGVDDATTDPGQIHRWWQVAPESNIGLACGFAVDIIDLDGPEGILSFLTALPPGRPVPPTIAQVQTGRGVHLAYPARPGHRNTVKRHDGIDTRARGGYVVAPPSIHEHGPRYRWLQAPYQPFPGLPFRAVDPAQLHARAELQPAP